MITSKKQAHTIWNGNWFKTGVKLQVFFLYVELHGISLRISYQRHVSPHCNSTQFMRVPVHVCALIRSNACDLFLCASSAYEIARLWCQGGGYLDGFNRERNKTLVFSCTSECVHCMFALISGPSLKRHNVKYIWSVLVGFLYFVDTLLRLEDSFDWVCAMIAAIESSPNLHIWILTDAVNWSVLRSRGTWCEINRNQTQDFSCLNKNI